MNNSQELSTFSHEINNSLTLIYGQIQYIEKTNDILTQNEHWNRMKDDFSSLFDFIHQFLAPEDTTSATIEPLDLINLISELRSSCLTIFIKNESVFLSRLILELHFMCMAQKVSYSSCFII